MAPNELVLRLGNLADAMPLIMAHHYTRRRTADPMFSLFWERAHEIEAAAIFTSPANRFFGPECVELSRLVRIPTLKEPLSRFISLCLRYLKRHTKLRYCLSYADSEAGHHGGIYQASNFIHVAVSPGHTMYRDKSTGDVVSARARDQRSPELKARLEPYGTSHKYLYVYPLHEPREALLERFGWSALPPPKPNMEPSRHA